MHAFLQKHASVVTGHLTGLDRIVLRGNLRQISYAAGMDKCLGVERVLIKDFGEFARSKSEALVADTKRETERRGRPLVFLPSPRVEKEDAALAIAKRDGVTSGLICVLQSVEPCMTFDIAKNSDTGHVEVVTRERKCSFFYHYAIHPKFGFMNARIQSWLPFTIQICLNGREWLARRMDEVGLRHERDDNTFPWIEDTAQAQALMDEQLSVDLESLLEGIARCLLPAYPRIFSKFETRYSWSVYQSEVATDVMFDDAASLAAVYRPLVPQLVSSFGSPDVIRFLGQRRATADGRVRANFSGEVTSDFKHRPEGVRVKHSVNGNSVKVYDKAERVLRVETTVNQPREFKVRRPKEGGPKRDVKLRHLRRGVVDLARRVEVSRQSNERYLDALASLTGTESLETLTGDLARPASLNGSRVRALNPHNAEDAALLRAVSRGEFVVNGFRNRDISVLLDPGLSDDQAVRCHRARTTRRLRLLRGHGLIERLSRTHRYQVTNKGRDVIAAIMAALAADVNRLVAAA